MKPKILSWNVRGCGAKEKRTLIKSFITKQHPDVVCLQETKLSKIDISIIRSLWGGDWCKWTSLDSVGASGGVLIMWDSRKLQAVDFEISSFSISCLFQHLEVELTWSFTGVYGPVATCWKSDFLEEVGSAVFRRNFLWCLGADFNMIRSIEDKWGSKKTTKQMNLFSDLIESLQGIDLPLSGSKYTWSNSFSKTRIDRFLVSTEWEDLFPKVIQKSLPRIVSDHFPILLDEGGLKTGPKPFRFENMWLQVEGFKEMVTQWWIKYSFTGSASYRLSQKLKKLKEDLKHWNTEVFGRIDQQKANLEKEIQVLDLKDEVCSLSEQERRLRKDKILQLTNLIKMEEIS